MSFARETHPPFCGVPVGQRRLVSKLFGLDGQSFMSKLKRALALAHGVTLRRCFLLFVFVAASAFAQGQARVYELRTYHCYEGKLETLKANFRDFDIRILKRHGIESIGYWVPRDPELAKNTLVYLVVHPSRAAAEKDWADLSKDPEFMKLAAESMKGGPIVQRVESMYLDPTDFSALQ